MSSKNQAAFIAAQAGVVPLLRGMPGVAKTATVNAFGASMDRPVYTLIGSIREPADIAGYPMLQNGDKPACMAFVPPSWVHQLNSQPSILFVDEITCCAPSVQAALLRVMAERVVGDTPLRDDTIVIAACNPPDQAAGGYDLEPPMANRLCHLDWEIDWEAWEFGLLKGLAFPAPKVPCVPENWKSRIPQWSSKVAVFRRHRTTLFADMPKDRTAQSGPWPSPRSWTNAIRCLAAADAVSAEDAVKHELLAGCVGMGPAGEFFTWLNALDLPDPNELLKAGIAAAKKGTIPVWQPLNRPDRVFASLSGVAALVVEKSTAERWGGAIALFEAAAVEATDIAIACAATICKDGAMPKGATLPKSFVDRFLPSISMIQGG